MLTPRAVHLLIKHFDAIDRSVAKRLTRKRPWSETALTSFLCDLLDAETQDEEDLDYRLADLNRELGELDGLLNLAFTLQTHEYDGRIERWVTQSDVGFVINFVDNMLPENSWRVSWLLQAKRLYPQQRNPVAYTEASRFGGTDSEQHRRVELLAGIVGIPFIKYLLYCPRPSFLDPIVERKLSHLRNQRLTHNIFDFTLGLELRDELSRRDSSLAAGLFVSDIDSLPSNLGMVHETLLERCAPLSWFLASHFVYDGPRFAPVRNHWHPDHPHHRPPGGPPPPEEEWAHGIVTGDDDAVTRVIHQLEERNEETIEGPFTFLPPHTITVDVTVGGDINDNFRRIRRE